MLVADLLRRFVLTFLALLTLVLSVVWVAGLYFGMYGGTMLAQYAEPWRQWWHRAFPLLNVTLILLALFFAFAFRLGWMQ